MPPLHINYSFIHLPFQKGRAKSSAMKNILFCSLLILGFDSQAKVSVLFHPQDQTLNQIALWLSQARLVDIAMYNMDVTDKSPIIQKLKTDSVQKRIKNGTLQIRMVFEGLSTRERNAQKMQALEDLGVDARFLGKDVKVHHKFATLDTGTDQERVITGSANWSLASASSYNENILFAESEPEISFRYQTEFDRLWEKSKPFGFSKDAKREPLEAADQKDVEIFFNSPRHLKLNIDEPNVLTEQIIKGIEAARDEIQIATTRIRLEPILNAVQKAANQGVRIKILLSQDDFKDLKDRAQWLFNNKNIQLRVKFYNLRVSQYLSFQMHNKFMIVDQKTLLTGSFNWSHSSENFHIENLVKLTDSTAAEVLPRYKGEFAALWDLGRNELAALKERLAKTKSEGKIPLCAFDPVSLEVPEINFLLSEYPKCERPPEEAAR